MSLHVPTEHLQRTLAQILQSHAHTNGTTPTPAPTLTIRGFKNPVDFPLTANQARRIIPYASPSPHGQSTRTVLDPSIRSSLQIEADKIRFPPTWQLQLSEIVNAALHDLNLESTGVQFRFDKLLMYRRGDHFRPHTDSEKVEGMFGTLVVQLPSRFTGGELVVRYDGKETVYPNGGDDGSCKNKIFYSAFFADVEHEIRPVKSGYRLVLVYNLIQRSTRTLGVGEAAVVGVAKALREMVEDAPCNAWMLALPLNHLYTISSLTRLGIAAFKSNDATNLAALRLAANNIGAGELEIAICVLSRWHEEIDISDRFAEYPHRVHILNIFDEDGNNFPDRLEFLDFSSAMDAAKLVITKQTKARYTGNEGVRRETLYRTAITFVWPRNKRFYMLAGDHSNLKRFLTEESEDSCMTRIDRALTWFESIHLNLVNPDSVAVLAGEIVERRLSRQAPRAMKLALGFAKKKTSRKTVVELVIQFGWRRFADLLEEFLCNSKLKKQRHLHGPMEILHELGRLVHQPVRIRALGILVNFFNCCLTRLKENLDGRYHIFYVDDEKDAIELFAMLLSTLMSAVEEVNAAGKRSLQELLDLAYPMLDEFNSHPLQTLNQKFEQFTEAYNVEWAKPLMEKLEPRIYHARKKRFLRECESILSRYAEPPSKKTNDAEGKSQEPHIRFGRFTELAFALMTHDPVPEEVSTLYWKFLSVLPRLPGCAVNEITDSVQSLQTSQKCMLPYIHGTVLHAKDITDVQELQEKERIFVAATASEPNEVQRCYNDVGTGIPKIDRFLRTKDMRFEFRVKNEEAAIDISERARRALPDGFEAISCRGECGGWVVEITKPFQEEVSDRINYEYNVKWLREVREEIKMIRERKRKLPDRDVAESLVKRSKRSDMSVMWKVYNM